MIAEPRRLVALFASRRVYPGGPSCCWPGVVAMIIVIAILVAANGCRTTRNNVDAEIVRNSAQAQQAFAEGADTEAIRRYRSAVKRAWALDDADQIARNAYNLAACLAAVRSPLEARDWLAEARAEFWRSGNRDGATTWLLEAKIAEQMGFLDDAESISLALHARGRRAGDRTSAAQQCAYWPAPNIATHDQHNRFAARSDRKRHGDRKDQAKGHPRRHGQTTTEAAAHLLRANLACDLGELERAAGELSAAQRFLRHSNDDSVQAEFQRTAGRLLLFEGRALEAARRFDAEASLLRTAGHYREMPLAWAAAGEAYEAEGQFAAAADRYQRAARMWYGQDHGDRALILIQHAVDLAQLAGDSQVEGRLAIVFGEIASAMETEEVSRQKKPTTSTPKLEAIPSPAAAPPLPVPHAN